MLSPDERLRYSRHLALPEIGELGQERLKSASVLIAGAGGLGSPAALYLAAAGVGRIGLIDEDRVSLSNLQRQILYATAEIGRPKVYAARDRLGALNPGVTIEPREDRLSEANIEAVLRGYDVILDGTDSFSSRYLINDACVILRKPLAYGAIERFEGQASFFVPGGPCYRCLYPSPPQDGRTSCANAGVLGVLPGMIGLIQAAEALKHLLGIGASLAGRLLLVNPLEMRFESFGVARNPDCPVCGDNPTIHAPSESEPCCALADVAGELTGAELATRIGQAILLDLRSAEEHAAAHIPGARRIAPMLLLSGDHEFGQDDELVLYCRSGSVSRRVVAELRASGFARAFHLKGGIEAWNSCH